MTAADALERMGKALFGKDWQRKTAALVEVHPGTVTKWMHGRVESFDRTHAVFPALVWHMRNRAKLLKQVADDIDGWIR